jgi:hypothetical protein
VLFRRKVYLHGSYRRDDYICCRASQLLPLSRFECYRKKPAERNMGIRSPPGGRLDSPEGDD